VRQVSEVRELRGVSRRLAREDGIALLVAMLAMLLLSALGAGLLLTTSSETIIAANFRSSAEEFYAAEAGLERVLDSLQAAPDWNAWTMGLDRSSFVDGPPSGVRTLGDGTTIDLAQVVNLANCQKITPCSDAEMDAVSGDRPWGSRNPRWVLCGYGPLSGVLPAGSVTSAVYIAVLVAGGLGQGSPPANSLALRAEAFGVRGGLKVIEATVARADTGVRMLSWRTVR
jgi:PilX N-terminal